MMAKAGGIGVPAPTRSKAVGVKVGEGVEVKVGVRVGNRVGVAVRVAEGEGVAESVGVGVAREKGELRRRQKICDSPKRVIKTE